MNRSHTRPFRFSATLSAAFAWAVSVECSSRFRTTSRAAVERVIYRKWAAVCPAIAMRLALSHFGENVFTECRNENRAIPCHFWRGDKITILSVVRLQIWT